MGRMGSCLSAHWPRTEQTLLNIIGTASILSATWNKFQILWFLLQHSNAHGIGLILIVQWWEHLTLHSFRDPKTWRKRSKKNLIPQHVMFCSIVSGTRCPDVPQQVSMGCVGMAVTAHMQGQPPAHGKGSCKASPQCETLGWGRRVTWERGRGPVRNPQGGKLWEGAGGQGCSMNTAGSTSPSSQQEVFRASCLEKSVTEKAAASSCPAPPCRDKVALFVNSPGCPVVPAHCRQG